MSSLPIMRSIPLFSCLLLFPFFLAADASKLEDLEKRLSIFPPTKQDYLPITKIVNDQMESIRSKNYEMAYFNYTSKGFRRKTSFTDFQLFIKSNKVLLYNKTLSLLSVRIDKNIGYYEAIATSDTGDVRHINYELIYEDDAWRVLGIQVLP
jgi:hypothetical protein